MNETKTPMAFPCHADNSTNTMPIWDKGMTLRDYFAAKALQMIVINDTSQRPENFRDFYAAGAYEWADAMLRARQQPQG